MKYSLFLILPCILAACATSPLVATEAPMKSGFALTKRYAITAEAETETAGLPANDATLTAILAPKSAGGTAMAATLTAQPSGTPIPAIPPGSPLCRSSDLKTTSASNGATGHILLGASLTNIGTTPCFLQTWPQVLLTDPAGKPLDVDYHYFDMTGSTAEAAATQQALSGATARTGLWPGWTAALNLIWDNWCQVPVPGGAVIHLKLAGNAGSLDIPTDVGAGGRCDLPGSRSTVGISPFGYVFATP